MTTAKRQTTGMIRPAALIGLAAIVGVIGALALVRGIKGGSASLRKPVMYQDSMHPWIKSDRPGKCTICAMDLTPIYQGEQGFAVDDGMVALSSNNITVLNVQTEEVRRQTLGLTMHVAGTLEPDETRKAIFSAPAAGRIEEMMAGAVGDMVEMGKPLLTFYSPDLTTWRRSYVVRGRTSLASTPLFAGRPHESTNSGGRAMPGGKGTKSMPDMPGMPAGGGSDSDPYFSDLLSPMNGTIVERKVFNGQYVTEGDRMLTIVDTSVLWFRFDVYERQLPWLAVGQKIRVTVASLPGQEFSGTISVIEPALDETTRTVKVRANIANPVVGNPAQNRRQLRLGMYAEGSVVAELRDVLTVPRSAIMSPGGRTFAYVEEAAGAYAQRTVRVGRQGDQFCEVLDGLEPGDRVVTAGNVLIDAQAQITRPPGQDGMRDSMSAPTPAPAQVKMPAAHAGMPTGSGDPGMGMTQGASGAAASSAVSQAMNPAQGKALDEFLAAAGELSAALAADSLPETAKAASRIGATTKPLLAEFGSAHPWRATIESIAAAAAWPQAKDLEAARTSFLPLSTRVVELVQFVKADAPGSRALKIYHCPMAPKPGLWFQSGGPLRNPFYGSEMLTCGSEVKGVKRPQVTGRTAAAPVMPALASPDSGAQLASVAVASPVVEAPDGLAHAEPAPDKAVTPPIVEPPVVQNQVEQAEPSRHESAPPVAPIKSLRTINTRSPEAKERMARAFAVGVAEKHRMANETALPQVGKPIPGAAPVGSAPAGQNPTNKVVAPVNP